MTTPPITHEVKPSFAAIRKGSKFEVVPHNIEVSGLKPYSRDKSKFNWPQAIAIKQLLDPSIHMNIINGKVGSGKTLISVAAGLHMVISDLYKYKKLIITRPMVPMEGKDNMGYLPGDKNAKMLEWLQPIYDSISFLTENNDNLKKRVETLMRKNWIVIQSLDHIRGRTWHDSAIILDESQNGTPYQVKTLAERVGENSKIILVGDVNQVDSIMVGKRSNGLAVMIDKMIINKKVSNNIVSLTELLKTERSELAGLVSDSFM